MATEPFKLEQLVEDGSPSEAALCEDGIHKPHLLWDWRCARCSCLLCLTCAEEIDRCQCTKGGHHA